ncbi:restriction endonuclease subunit S [Stutzerimonas stutzeri]|uniref:restriction endonuclease subunit S n=1 Tax=Stutzerimonas stutzeri TaxID=316 RepID=UPI0021AE226A|nr:restriction endonuclease subunit S [Stutzerimonas stutzeri]
MSSEWPTTRLGECCFSIEDGDWIETKDQGEQGYRLLQISNIGLGCFRETGNFRWVTPETFQRLRCNEIRVGDVLVARMPEPTGRCWFVDNLSWPAITAVDVAIVRTNPELLDPLYCSYFLNSPQTLAEVSALTVGTTRTRIKRTDLAALEVTLPPLHAQRIIARNLRMLDDRITLLRETNATLESIAQALFKSWFVDFDPVRAKAEGRQPEGMDAITAALFPDSFEESELGLVPKGWAIAKFGDFINRLSVGQKYDQKSAFPDGTVPVLDQGKSGIIGYHNDSPGVRASLEAPVVVFANHTCYMRLITFDFSAIQNVLPFNGRGVDTVWVFYATKDRVKFSEYKGHWPDFAIEKSVLPPAALTYVFRDAVDPVIRKIRFNELQAQTLTQLRDTLLPRLISGQLRLPEAEALLEDSL